ncbi:MAG: hypothetical protein AB7F35_10630 [Acetobacteraceae bacterium]
MAAAQKGFLHRTVESAAKALYRDAGNEFTYGLDDIRHKVVEQAAWGRTATPEAVEFYRWLSDDKQATAREPDAAEKDPLGRTSEEAEPEPMEGRPSTHQERISTAVAYARHREAGPYGTMEMENAHAHEWREFEEWIDGHGENADTEEPEAKHDERNPQRQKDREAEREREIDDPEM